MFSGDWYNSVHKSTWVLFIWWSFCLWFEFNWHCMSIDSGSSDDVSIFQWFSGREEFYLYIFFRTFYNLIGIIIIDRDSFSKPNIYKSLELFRIFRWYQCLFFFFGMKPCALTLFPYAICIQMNYMIFAFHSCHFISVKSVTEFPMATMSACTLCLIFSYHLLTEIVQQMWFNLIQLQFV